MRLKNLASKVGKYRLITVSYTHLAGHFSADQKSGSQSENEKRLRLHQVDGEDAAFLCWSFNVGDGDSPVSDRHRRNA